MIEPIAPPDSHYLLAAQGWAELGNLAEAEAELQSVAPARRFHPDVLACRYGIYARFKQWDRAAEVADHLMEVRADEAGSWVSLAYAVRRKSGGGIPQAREILTRALALFPAESMIVYNLACYDCQLGQEVMALEWLKMAIALAGKKPVTAMALADADLQPLWQKIALL